MCGIAGKFVFQQGQRVSVSLLKQMCDTLVHRGPDDEGYYLDGPIGLGHRRLSIIDLEAGRQPISNEDENVWVVFNGEIYNYLELRNDLISRNHTFRTQTDTEVLVHLYEERGEDFVSALRGMFAFALWDKRRQTLVLARDRVGKKPLFYSVQPGHGVIFGSEIKAILKDPDVKRHVNLEALDAMLSLLYVPSPLSIFEEIYRLPAGHILVVTSDKVTLKQYWDLTFHPQEGRSDRDYEDEFENILSEAVKIRLRSDVPLGAFLSGGVDSTSVVAAMAMHSERPIVTCSVGFDDLEHNELAHARAVAEHLRCDHHEYLISPAIRDLVPSLVRYFDEPFSDSSAIPSYYVSKIARQHVTVALSGDGGDEVFAGYSRHYLEGLEHRLRRILGAFGPGLATIADYAPRIKGRQTLRRLGMTPDAACAHKHCGFLFESELKNRLYSQDLRRECRDFDPAERFRSYYNQCTAADPLNKALYVDIKTYLCDDILVKVDRMSMAHALEVRAPLLDHKLLEFAARLPASLKLRGRTSKVLLKRFLKGRVPADVITRRKHGFTMPLARWLRRELREVVEDTLLSPRAVQRGFFSPPFVRRLWMQHLSAEADYAHELWILTMFELWHREYLD